MFWSDEIAQKLKERKFPLEWIDDMKTPSGRIHVGSLRGVVVHDLIYKSLLDQKIKAHYSFVFDDHDPMDDVPPYLKETHSLYLGMPLFKVPSPEKGYENYARFYAEEFKKVFNTIGCNPEIIWATDLYKCGKMNGVIKEVLDNADKIRKIYEKMYKKKIAKPWYPFVAFCTNCGKESTTTVTDWDGEKITYSCDIDKVKWTKGCGHKEKISPFSSKDNIAGKMPWKVEWPAKWKAIGITVEGAGKDHMSAGGSHDIAEQICKQVLKYPVPYPFAYEWFIVGGKKMSTSKGVGTSAIDMLDILPPQLLRFLMTRSRINSEINFDLNKPSTVPDLFDEYQRCADAYFQKGDPDFARAFELSQIGKVQRPPTVRFSVLAQWIQMPNMAKEIEKEGISEWAPFAKYWLENFAPESEKFFVQEALPEMAKDLSGKQRELLSKIATELDHDWDGEKLQFDIYEWGKALGLGGKDVFGAIYLSLLGKNHGPKAAWLILSLDKDFVKIRFQEAASGRSDAKVEETNKKIKTLNNANIFYIDPAVKNKFPSISVGVAVIKDVSIEKTKPELEEQKNTLLSSLEGLTTEQLGQYPETISYRKIYKEMGLDWHSRRPSPEALLRRVALKKGLYNVNTCVDAYNLIVMKNRVSVGAFDLDSLHMPTVLRFAKLGEQILLLGDKEPTKYTEKELAYFDKNKGFNIDFNFRDSQETAVQLTTKNLYINVDGVYDVTPEKVEKVLQETCDMILKYCGGKLETFGVETA